MASLSTIQVGDLVEVDIRGSVIIAEVRLKSAGKLHIRPVGKAEGKAFMYSQRDVTSRQVLRHWRQTKNVKKIGSGQSAAI